MAESQASMLEKGTIKRTYWGSQSLKPLENPHWLLDYMSTGFSIAFLRVLNSPRIHDTNFEFFDI